MVINTIDLIHHFKLSSFYAAKRVYITFAVATFPEQMNKFEQQACPGETKRICISIYVCIKYHVFVLFYISHYFYPLYLNLSQRVKDFSRKIYRKASNSFKGKKRLLRLGSDSGMFKWTAVQVLQI